MDRVWSLVGMLMNNSHAKFCFAIRKKQSAKVWRHYSKFRLPVEPGRTSPPVRDAVRGYTPGVQCAGAPFSREFRIARHKPESLCGFPHPRFVFLCRIW